MNRENHDADVRHVLVIEDEPQLRSMLADNLEFDGYHVTAVASGEEGLRAFAQRGYSLLLLDVMLPGVDGFEVCRTLRAQGTRVPIILLTARTHERDRVKGLNLGADDYVSKPFSPAELVARVRRILERTAPSPPEGGRPPLEHGDLVVDRERHEVWLAGSRVELTSAEFRLLTALLEAEGRVLTREQLLDSLHGMEDGVLDRTIDVHIGRLRGKLGDDASAPSYIATVRGIGYRAAPPGAQG